MNDLKFKLNFIFFLQYKWTTNEGADTEMARAAETTLGVIHDKEPTEEIPKVGRKAETNKDNQCLQTQTTITRSHTTQIGRAFPKSNHKLAITWPVVNKIYSSKQLASQVLWTLQLVASTNLAWTISWCCRINSNQITHSIAKLSKLSTVDMIQGKIIPIILSEKHHKVSKTNHTCPKVKAQPVRVKIRLSKDSRKNRVLYTMNVSININYIVLIILYLLLVFIQFSGDGQRISAIEFFKLCKLCKIYPVVITFEDLKKIVLKNKEFW